jgi:hypothetical protein
LFCAATGIEHAVGILAQAMQSMALRGFIVHDRQSLNATARPHRLAPIATAMVCAPIGTVEAPLAA